MRSQTEATNIVFKFTCMYDSCIHHDADWIEGQTLHEKVSRHTLLLGGALYRYFVSAHRTKLVRRITRKSLLNTQEKKNEKYKRHR